MPDLVIRPFAETDRAACQQIAADAALSSYGAQMPEMAAAFLPSTPLEVVEARLVAMLDGALVGFIDINGDHIENLFVAPPAQGAGVGSRLMAAVESEAAGDLTLSVFTVNPGARRLYERLGFVVTTERDIDFYGRPYRVWAMRKARL